MADDTATMESVAPPNLTQANQPIYGDPGQPQEPSTVVPAGAPNPAAAAPGPAKGGLWGQVLVGALAGLAGGSQVRGRGGFAAGAAAGASSYLNHEQLVTENQQRASMIQFESARAAAETADALTRAKQEDRASKLTQAQIDSLNSNTSAYLSDHNISPNLTVAGSTPSEIHTSAIGGLSTLAQQNGGTVPRVATFGSPAGVGENPDTHSVTTYHAGQQPGADKRGIIDDYLQATRGLKSTDSEWNTGFGKVAPGEDIPAQGLKTRDARSVGQDDQFVTAMQFMQVPTVPFKDGKVDTGAAASLQQTLEQQAQNYSKLPNAKPDYADFLQKKADTFAKVTKDVVAHAAASDSARIAGTAGPEAAPTHQARADAKSTIASYGNDPEIKGLSKEVDDATSVADLQKIQTRADDLNKTRTLASAQRSFAEGQKDVARQTEIAKQLTPIWTKDGFSDTLTQANQIKQAAAQSQSGDGLMTSLLPTMEVLGVNMAGKVRRISPTEYDAAKTNPQIVTRWNQMYDAAKSGASTDKIVAQANQLADLLVNQAHDKAVRNAGVIANQFGQPHNQVAALDHNGNPTTLDKVEAPSNATGKAPDPKTGKLYWHDASGKALAPVL